MKAKITGFKNVKIITCEVAPYGHGAPLKDHLKLEYEALIGGREFSGDYFKSDFENKTFNQIKEEILNDLREGLKEQ